MGRSMADWAWLVGTRIAFVLGVGVVLAAVTVGVVTVTTAPAIVFGTVAVVAAGCVLLGHAGSWWYRSREAPREALATYLRDRVGRMLAETALVLIGVVVLLFFVVGYLAFP